MKAAVLGASGYTGSVLMRILLNHPQIEKIFPVSRTKAGTKTFHHDPGLSQEVLEKKGADLFRSFQEAENAGPDVVFSALPHLKSAEYCRIFLTSSVVIDLSADFRITDPDMFRRSYGTEPPAPDLLKSSVYSLCEWNREKIKHSDLIANPGCYPTAVLLPLLPLIYSGIVNGTPVADVMTGISGGGRSLKDTFLYSERTENMGAYSPGRSHRHYFEMVHQIRNIAGTETGDDLIFNPHLVPVKQGMAATITAPLRDGAAHDTVHDAFYRAYSDEPFIRLRGENIPETRHVRWTNRCDIGYRVSDGFCIIFSVIDNLLKGASGQAVQTMNIRFGLTETAGLDLYGEI
ncbi:MAG: N-acetyl-gamma-glutamyl-phosphate reductase [Spirochaetia bacterium]